MTTLNTQITEAWTKIADISDLSLLATWDIPVTLEVAVTSVNSAPTVSGHILSNNTPITRALLGAGYVWAKTAVGAYPKTIQLKVSSGLGDAAPTFEQAFTGYDPSIGRTPVEMVNNAGYALIKTGAVTYVQEP